MFRFLPHFFLLTTLMATLTRPSVVYADDEKQNWFHDPFFQISNAVTDCPMPAGPFVTVAQRTAEAHHRAERGTTCWLTGKCDRPSSYDYDQDIADAFRKALATDNPFSRSTLWVTVQGRSVFIEGCADDRTLAARVEAFTMALPYVQIAVAKIRFNPSAVAPYTLLNNP